MKKILLGTTNPSKINRFKEYLTSYDVEFLTLNDFDRLDIPIENGNTPKENACIKAKFYSQYFDCVVCGDSGLYFIDYPIDDPIQPGLKVRRVQGKELNDQEMIEYYSQLAHSQGGQLLSCYIDGIAVYNEGRLYSFMEVGKINRCFAFYLCDHQVNDYHEGWPLDSLSKRDIMLCDEQEIKIEKEKYNKRLNRFLVESLGLFHAD